MCRLLRVVLLRFLGRQFVFVGDSGYGTHEVARFAHQHRARLALVSKLHPEANMFDPSLPYHGNGPPRVKGGRRPKPREAVEPAWRRRRLTVRWYGGGTRRVSIGAGAGHWYKAGTPWSRSAGPTSATWRGPTATSTSKPPTCLDLGEIVTLYAGRWNTECTFQECRAHLRSGTTRDWCRRTVLRAAPCLFGLYSVVALLYHVQPEGSGPVGSTGRASPA